MKLEYVQLHKQRKRKILFWFSCLSITLLIISALILIIILLNPYGLREYLLSIVNNIGNFIHELFREKDELYEEDNFLDVDHNNNNDSNNIEHDYNNHYDTVFNVNDTSLNIIT